MNHHGGKQELVEQSLTKDVAQTKLFSYMIDRLKDIKEVELYGVRYKDWPYSFISEKKR